MTRYISAPARKLFKEAVSIPGLSCNSRKDMFDVKVDMLCSCIYQFTYSPLNLDQWISCQSHTSCISVNCHF